MTASWLRGIGLMAVLWGGAIAAGAAPLPDLYAVGVPVAGQGNADLQRAAAQGLRELAVRLSGRSDAENSSALNAAFASPERYLEQYRYERNATNTAAAMPWIAQLRFSAGQVNQLLRGAGLPTWGASRPLLQAWIVVDDGKGRRLLEDGDDSIVAALRGEAQRRGIALKFASRGSAVSADDVAQLNMAKVQAASPPAAGEMLLLGQLTTSDGNAWSGSWQLGAGAQQLGAEASGTPLGAALRPAIDRLIDGVAAQYAVAPGSIAEGIELRVAGIETFDDYAGLLNYLGRLAILKGVRPAQVSADTVTLQLKIQGSVEQLVRQLALESRLAPAQSGNVAATSLQYRWMAPRS